MKAASHTRTGVAVDTASPPATLVIACGALSHELVAVSKANHWVHLDIQCLPAHWHNTPEKITPAIEQKIQDLKQHYSRIFVAYADCGTGGKLDALLNRHRIERLPGDHCYGFFAGQQVFDGMAEDELGTFYLTDYLVDHFQRLIIDGLGISRFPELQQQYFAHYTRLMYLRQDPDSAKREKRLQLAGEAARKLSLPLHVHDTGLAQFSTALAPLGKIEQPVHFMSAAVSRSH